jgi:hypothetical protein
MEILLVIPGLTRDPVENPESLNPWIPAFAGMTKKEI